MTREEKIEILEKEKAYMIAHGGDRQAEALTSAIKALEQEPVLGKIRAEIEELDRYFDNDYFSTNNCPMYKCNEVLLIIDKYREESEG